MCLEPPGEPISTRPQLDQFSKSLERKFDSFLLCQLVAIGPH
jgi:hypothetical protein